MGLMFGAFVCRMRFLGYDRTEGWIQAQMAGEE